jgi:hypothetical protein
MKFNDKQIDDIARLLGTLAASSIVGFSIGIARPHSVTGYEEIGLLSSAVITFITMVLIRRNQ